jgi:uncharacterized protein YjbJ (UPF0337 family)/ElaB/YqjD/DUF883 family membrane-anchored ribosome-binding protein
MNWDKIASNWKQIKHSAWEEWDKLTEDDKKIVNSEVTKLLDRLQLRYGYSRDQAELAVKDWYDKVQTLGGDLAASLMTLQKDVARLAASMNVLLQHQTLAAGERLSKVVGDAEESVLGAASAAQDNICSATKKIESSIERNPVTAVLIALGIGLSIGIISRPRR